MSSVRRVVERSVTARRNGPDPPPRPAARGYGAAMPRSRSDRTDVTTASAVAGSGLEALTPLERVKAMLLKPEAPGPSRPGATVSHSDAALRELARRADDRERLVGFVAAPLAALVAMMVVAALAAGDPPARLRDGGLDRLHVSLSLYYGLEAVLFLLSLAVLLAAMWRKRTGMAVAMALYGLALFNLGYWGFAVPYVFAGSWLLVRSYRYQRELRARP